LHLDGCRRTVLPKNAHVSKTRGNNKSADGWKGTRLADEGDHFLNIKFADFSSLDSNTVLDESFNDNIAKTMVPDPVTGYPFWARYTDKYSYLVTYRQIIKLRIH